MTTQTSPVRRVLILDACQRSALAATRSLGGRGLHIITADIKPATLAGASKFSSRCVQYPDPSTHHCEFVAAIATAVREHSVDIVMPMTDLTTMLLVTERDRLAPAQLSCAAADSYESLSDKAALVARATGLGVPVPQSHVVHSAVEASQVARQLQFPLVVKPSRSRYLHARQIHSTQVRIAACAADLEAICKEAAWLQHIPGLVQEYIPGYGAGVFALGDGTNVAAWFAHRRIREKPPSGGVSVLCESVAADPIIQQHAERLLQSTGWFGPAMVEFRVATDGTPYLMEVNGRFWGSLQLSIDSGIDFPWLLCRLLSGESLPPQSYATGQRLRWLLGDVDNLLIQLRTRGNGTRKFGAIADFTRSCWDFSARQEILRWSDASPALHEFKTWLKAFI